MELTLERLEEFTYYKNIAINLFNYMNGKINRNILARFVVDYYDPVYDVFGYTAHPGNIHIFLAAIIDSYEPFAELAKQTCGRVPYNRYEYICNEIAWVIAHELHHVDHKFNLVKYGDMANYKAAVENVVEYGSQRWILNHKRDISNIMGCNVIIDNITSESMYNSDVRFQHAKPKDIYMQIILGTIIRNVNIFKKMDILMHDEWYNDIVACFINASDKEYNNLDFLPNDNDPRVISNSIMIKQQGQFLVGNLPRFVELVNTFANPRAIFNVRMISNTVSKDGIETIGVIYFIINEPIYFPVTFPEMTKTDPSI